MLYSMTGYGEARRQVDGLAVGAEVRTINSRHFKLSYRSSDGYASLESRVEAVVRKHIRRGTVQIQLRVDRPHTLGDYRLNTKLINAFRRELVELAKQWDGDSVVSVDALLALPGVVEEVTDAQQHAIGDWPLLESCLTDALAQLRQMRADEGASLAADLVANCQAVAKHLESIEALAPKVVVSYRDRIAQRVNKLLAELDVSVEPADLVREVSLFADRCDISEEIVRLRSHLEQFEETVNNEEMAGKKLEFIAQEMGRETNTIGSKANDTQIAREVVELKAALERIREQVQNVE